MSLREDADKIIKEAIRKVLPDEAVAAALNRKLADGSFKVSHKGRILVVSIGKAGWQMARAAYDTLGSKISGGVVVTKYDHVRGEIPGFTCYEAGHPVPDENSFKATQAAIDLVTGLTADDLVIFLVSGGGSALFEKPLVSGEELADVTSKLLACGADIVEMNTIRKRLSAVKGGKFARLCHPARVYSIVLSDIIGDPLDMIASGPAYPDSSSAEDALRIIDKYNIRLSDEAKALMRVETPKALDNVETEVTGSVRNLCRAAADEASRLGYEPVILTDQLTCQAREAGDFLAAIARTHATKISEDADAAGRPVSVDAEQIHHTRRAFIAGGETVVHLTGKGKGGRNQELALAAAEGIAGLDNVCVFSVGSDGTDGPTDAAGGYADGYTKEKLQVQGISIYEVLKENDAYNALKKTDGLVITGPTGTNVNDFAAVLIG